MAVILIGPASLLLAQKVMHLDLPTLLTSDEASYLAGGKEEVHIRTNLNVQGLVSGELQRSFEKDLGNYIPCKFYALLGNAAFQRNFISLSNAFFGWPCYPTYYGSDYVYLCEVEGGALTKIVEKGPHAYDEKIRSFIDSLKEFANTHQDVTFLVYLTCPNDSASQYNPTSALTSNSRTYEDVQKAMQDCIEVNPASNLIFDCLDFDSMDIYYQQMYVSDSHWNICGTLTAYESICQDVSYPYFDMSTIMKSSNQFFAGDVSRSSLFFLPAPTYDTTYDFSNLTAHFSNGSNQDLDTHPEFADSSQVSKTFNYYILYYGLYENAVITGGKGKENTLLIADSFGNSLTRPIAESSKTTIRSDALFGYRENSTDLMYYFENSKIDTVIFVGTPWNYKSFMDRNPDFFGSS